MTEYLEVQRWANNAEMIAAAFELHVWPKRWAQGRVIDVLDPTFGKGLWWTWRDPAAFMNFVSHDIRQDGVDFRDLPEDYDSFDVVTFDPDYVAPGGRETSTIPDFNDRYGLKAMYESPASLQVAINAGITECARVLRPQGILMVKCMSYISSGKPWPGEFYVIKHGMETLGLRLEDIHVPVMGTGPQPKHERQQHFRSNSSRLVIFRQPGRRKRSYE